MSQSTTRLHLELLNEMPHNLHPDLRDFIASALRSESVSLWRAARDAAHRWLAEKPGYGLRASINNYQGRAKPGEGEGVCIYVLGPYQDQADSIVRAFGKISAGCSTLGEDFAKCTWPVVVKVKMGVLDQQLAQHLRDLADSIDRRPEPRPNADETMPF